LSANGRQTHSEGATLLELAQIMKGIGCVNALNLDGGGSSAIIAGGTLLNKPSDGSERAVATVVSFVKRNSYSFQVSSFSLADTCRLVHLSLSIILKNSINERLFLLIFAISVFFTSNAINAVVYDGSGQLAEDKMLAMTLAGIVNRDAPRLYLRNVYETWSYNQTDELWENEYKTNGAVQFTVITNINVLVEHFKTFIKGAVTYDATLSYSNFTGQSFRWQAEAAALLGGLTDCVPVPSTNTTIDINKPTLVDVPDYFNGQQTIQVSAKLELSTHTWNNAALTLEQRYFAWLDWALDNLLPCCNTSKFYLREITDWAVNQRMFQLNLAGTEDLRFTSLSDEKSSQN